MAGTASAAFDPAIISTCYRGPSLGMCGVGTGLIVLLIVSATLVARRRAFSLIWAALGLASLGWVGHAAGGSGLAGFGRELNQSIHLLAAGLWLGALLPLGWLLRHSGEERFSIVAGQVLPAFSHIGYGAVAAIAVTGVVNTLVLAAASRCCLVPIITIDIWGGCGPAFSLLLRP